MWISFDPLATQALDLMNKSSKSLFLTGKAGTGKSTLIQYFIETTKKNILVLAPTWVAAVNIGGTTIHSFFGMHPWMTLEEAKEWKFGMNALKWKILDKLDTIIIDEISMVRADMMDIINEILQTVYGNKLPFGGKQMIFVWDVFQLPPIVRYEEQMFFEKQYWSSYFFASPAYQALKVITIELQHIYRQDDADFKSILNKIRLGIHSIKDLEMLNTHVWTSKDKDLVIHLMTTNADADTINQQKLRQITADPVHHFSDVEGDVPPSMYMNSNDLVFKPWAQVMMLVNGPKYKNGSIGTLIERDDFEEIAHIQVSGEIVEVEVHTRNIRKPSYDKKANTISNEVVWSFTQLPFKLARAITIHKSQWLTFDNVIIDFGDRVFAKWQTYVALSRVSSLEGLTLTRPLRMADITIDTKVREYMSAQLAKQSEDKIKSAIEQEHSITFSYINYANQISERVVEPKEIDIIKNKWHTFLGLIGYCEQEKKSRAFHMERMFEIEVVGE